VISFCRTTTVTADFPGEDTIRLRGLLEDHIYAMELEMDVRISDGVITAVTGSMKRFTTPWCPDAVAILQEAVGLSLREQGWISRVNRDIGRQGCTHFAEILIECGRCLDTAQLSRAVTERIHQDADLSPEDAAQAWIDDNPTAWILSSS
jgi:hypothetical protein